MEASSTTSPSTTAHSAQSHPVQIRLARRPSGLPDASTFSVTHDASPDPREGEVTVAVEYISLDPAMRGWMNEGRSYVPPVGIGEVMRAGGAGRVVASKAAQFKEGDAVVGLTGVQTRVTGPASAFTKVDTRLAPLETYLGGLGMTGMTAYFGLLDIGQPKAGETVVVSAAAGAVGALVGQIAKIKGCHVVGVAGGAEKCAYVVQELGFDACLDYRAGSIAEGLKQHCPKRIDVYFDNVGGPTLEACLAGLAMKGRVVLCGAISQYNDAGGMRGPANYMSLLINRGRMEGFVVFDYAPRYHEAVSEMAAWHAQGKLKFRNHIVEGIETFPDTLLMLFRGENFGKLMIKV